MQGLVWFREDLRVSDHTALANAINKCQNGVVGLYIIDSHLFKKHFVAPVRIDFILRGLKELKRDLSEYNIPLLVIEVSDTKIIPSEIIKHMQLLHLEALFFNRQYEVNESRRDKAVCDALSAKKIAYYTYDDQTILPPGTVTTQQGHFFSIYTPYKRAWHQEFLLQSSKKLLPKPKVQSPLAIENTVIPTSLKGLIQR
jgi:deoxyribodipyrimidine photo-lyase